MSRILRTRDEHAQSLANYLPGGRLFKQKNINNSNFRKLLRGLAGELFTADGYLRTYRREIIPSQTVAFIDEWEHALGIPDDCFAGSGSLTERRRDVVIKLASLGVQTADDFEYVASLLGVTATVSSAKGLFTPDYFPMTFPFILGGVATKMERFTILVKFTVFDPSRFPITFPYTFGNSIITVLQCLFERLKPANCDIIFQEV